MTIKRIEYVVRAPEDMQISPDDVREKLKSEARRLAIGETESTTLDLMLMARFCTDEDFYLKLTPQYVRVVMSRVPEVVQNGRITIKVRKHEDTGTPVYDITFKQGAKQKRILTESDLPQLERKWKDKFIGQLLKIQPQITDLTGEALEGANIAIGRFHELLKEQGEV